MSEFNLRAKIIALIVGGTLATAGFVGWFVMQQNNDAPTPPDKKQTTQRPPDTTAPTIQLNVSQESLLAAAQHAKLQVAIQTDNYKDVARVEYLLDGVLVAYSTTAPFTVDIDLSGLSPGQHTLQAVAYDMSGNVGKSELFTFLIATDQPVAASNAASRTTVLKSVSAAALQQSVASSSGSSGDSGGGDDGGPVDTTPWPDEPPVLACGNSALLNGPSSAPAGAVVIAAGDNSGIEFDDPNTTYWFAPGVHTLGSDQFSQIAPRNNTTFVGAPGAIIDGQNLNRYAFTGAHTNVKIQYLTIRNFNAPRDEGVINHDSATGWTIEYITAEDNKGGAVFLGTDNMLRYSCLKDNGQYGFQVFSNEPGGPSNATMDHNEIVGNNVDDWESQVSGCGCTGGGKFWDAHGVTVTNNYVHHNLSVGLWADTNDTDFLIEGNYISDNDSQGVFYEISYNMIVRNNLFLRNGLVGGPGNSSFPTGAIYLSEAGGDNRVAGRTDKIDIYDNQFTDNWGGVILWENADRFCASPANTSTGYCTIVNPSATLTTCGDPGAGGSVNTPPYTSDCRWKTQNVHVHDNIFSMDKDNIPSCSTVASCGFQGIFSNSGSFPSWSPYMGDIVQQDITFNQNNLFTNNAYIGDWKFRPKTESITLNFAIWQAAPYLQDIGSTYNGEDHQSITNYLDDNTSTLEASIGQWQNWFSSTISRSAAEAHTGTRSLKVDITAPFGWGVQLSDPVGPFVTPAEKTVSFWAKLGAGTNLRATMEVRWLDEDQNQLRADTITSPVLTSSWQQALGTFTPPAGTVTVSTVFNHSSGEAGDSLYLDDIVIGDVD